MSKVRVRCSVLKKALKQNMNKLQLVCQVGALSLQSGCVYSKKKTKRGRGGGSSPESEEYDGASENQYESRCNITRPIDDLWQVVDNKLS